MQQQRLTWGQRWAAIALCAVGCSGVLLARPVSLMAQDRPYPQSLPSSMLHTLTVTGQASEKISATLADVQLGVEAQGKTAKQVQAEVAQRSAAVVALLKSRNVLKLQTTGITLSPQYDYNNGKQTLNGYQASNVVSFRVPTEQAGTLLDDAVQTGASRIDSVSFAAADAAIEEAQKVALRKAAQDAQNQAKAVLTSLGLSPKEIVNIQLNGANVPPPSPYPVAALRANLAEAKVASTPVEGGEQSVQASVTLQISY